MQTKTETPPGPGTFRTGKSVPSKDTTAAIEEQRAGYGFGLVRGPAATPEPAQVAWEVPEDRADATLSPEDGKSWVEDLIRPGRIIVIAAEEGTGKTMALAELGIRILIHARSLRSVLSDRALSPVRGSHCPGPFGRPAATADSSGASCSIVAQVALRDAVIARDP